MLKLLFRFNYSWSNDRRFDNSKSDDKWPNRRSNNRLFNDSRSNNSSSKYNYSDNNRSNMCLYCLNSTILLFLCHTDSNTDFCFQFQKDVNQKIVMPAFRLLLHGQRRTLAQTLFVIASATSKTWDDAVQNLAESEPESLQKMSVMQLVALVSARIRTRHNVQTLLLNVSIHMCLNPILRKYDIKSLFLTEKIILYLR